jgi:hypothetical protein
VRHREVDIYYCEVTARHFGTARAGRQRIATGAMRCAHLPRRSRRPSPRSLNRPNVWIARLGLWQVQRSARDAYHHPVSPPERQTRAAISRISEACESLPPRLRKPKTPAKLAKSAAAGGFTRLHEWAPEADPPSPRQTAHTKTPSAMAPNTSISAFACSRTRDSFTQLPATRSDANSISRSPHTFTSRRRRHRP